MHFAFDYIFFVYSNWQSMLIGYENALFLFIVWKSFKKIIHNKIVMNKGTAVYYLVI